MNNCSCVYMAVDCEAVYKVLKSEISTAKKQLVCCECNRRIPIGEKYEFIQNTLCWEKNIYTHITCLDCKSIKDSFFKCGYHYEHIIEDLEFHIEEYAGEISSDCIVSLTKRAKGMVCDMIEKYWDDWDMDEYWGYEDE